VGPVQKERVAPEPEGHQYPGREVCWSSSGGFKLVWQGDGNRICSSEDGVASVQADTTCSEVVRKGIQSKEHTCRPVDWLKCVYFNARSIKNKVDELGAWVSTWNLWPLWKLG